MDEKFSQNNTSSQEEDSHSLVSAIRDKYEGIQPCSGNGVCQIYIPKNGPGAKGCKDYVAPPRLSVDNCSISEAGNEVEIESLCGRVQELDLTKNRIRDWCQVFLMVQHIPMLHFLNLSFNPLGNSTFPKDLPQSFGHITALVLNGTNVSWNVVGSFARWFPRLRELHLSLNNYESVDLPDDTCQKSLSKLFLNNCRFHQWTDIAKLGVYFPCLEFLNIIKSNIESVSSENVKESFKLLKNLNLSGNPLCSWEEIDKFRLFSALQNLRIAEVPFLDKFSEKERRQHLVSRLPNITILNGSKISELEREDAERAFIRHYMEQDMKPQRFHELEAQHGKLEPLVHIDLSPKNVVQIQVKFEEKAEVMDVDVRQTIFDFKKLLRNFTGLPPLKFRMFHVVMFEGKHLDTNELKLVNKTLLSSKLRDGDEIHIEEKY